MPEVESLRRQGEFQYISHVPPDELPALAESSPRKRQSLIRHIEYAHIAKAALEQVVDERRGAPLTSINREPTLNPASLATPAATGDAMSLAHHAPLDPKFMRLHVPAHSDGPRTASSSERNENPS
jgi:hypothetical protein